MPDYIITCDGGSLDNAQINGIRMGYGSYILEIPSRKFVSQPKRLDFGAGVTNSEAEYMAAIAAMQLLSDVLNAGGDHAKEASVLIRTDSQMVIGHMTKNWKKKLSLLPLCDKLVELIAKFKEVAFEKVKGDEIKQIIGH